MVDCSEDALELLQWLADVETDPARRALMLTGPTLAAAAVADGQAVDVDHFTVLVAELRAHGYLTWTTTRNDQ